MQRRYLNNIRPEYSRVYRIKPQVTVNVNQELDAVAETEEATTTTTTEPTTTTTTLRRWDLGSGWDKKSSHRRTDLMVSDQGPDSITFKMSQKFLEHDYNNSFQTSS